MSDLVTLAVVELRLEGEAEAPPRLDDSQVAWWLADDSRLADARKISSQDPAWACPICAEGLEAEHEHGWVVSICTERPGGGLSSAAAAASAGESAGDSGDGHIYHEACLRQWLLKKNACPVCRRSPVVPEGS